MSRESGSRARVEAERDWLLHIEVAFTFQSGLGANEIRRSPSVETSYHSCHKSLASVAESCVVAVPAVEGPEAATA